MLPADNFLSYIFDMFEGRCLTPKVYVREHGTICPFGVFSPMLFASKLAIFPLKRSVCKSWFSGRGWGQQLFSFQSPAVQWMARTSSLNCLSCRNPYQTPDSLNCLPSFHWKPLFFTEKCFVASPSQKSALSLGVWKRNFRAWKKQMVNMGFRDAKTSSNAFKTRKTGKSLDSPENGNVDKMSKKCRKNVRKMSKKVSRGAENTILGQFLRHFLCLFGPCSCLVTLSNARPLMPLKQGNATRPRLASSQGLIASNWAETCFRIRENSAKT